MLCQLHPWVLSWQILCKWGERPAHYSHFSIPVSTCQKEKIVLVKKWVLFPNSGLKKYLTFLNFVELSIWGLNVTLTVSQHILHQSFSTPTWLGLTWWQDITILHCWHFMLAHTRWYRPTPLKHNPSDRYNLWNSKYFYSRWCGN